VRVVENLYPVATIPDSRLKSALGLPFAVTPAVGIHEVVVETPRHEEDMAARDPDELRLTLLAWQSRLRALFSMPGIRYVAIFKNKGFEAGTSLEHPHSQIVALSRIPDAIRRDVQRARRYFRTQGRCLVCDQVDAERQASERMVLERGNIIGFVPFGASAAGAIRIAPTLHAASFGEVGSADVEMLSLSLGWSLRAIDGALDGTSFNLVLVTAPKRWRMDKALHWYIDIYPRTSELGGFELATRLNVCSLPPEVAADNYRRQLKTI
jgi:UDPglucose--hexose-1-phosphate uridylyltransferase